MFRLLSLHIARRAINQARASLLKLLGVSVPTPVPSNSNLLSTIWFTGCGTEADNLAIQLAIQCHSTQHKKHIVTSNVEHPAIELYLKHLLDVGVLDDVTFVPVNEDGIVDAKDMINAIKENGETILVTLMLANNESGALQPVKEVSMACRERGVLFHTDAAQAAGKVSLHLENALGNPDMVSIVGHKIGAMKGIGALYVRDGCLDERSRKLPHDHGIMIIGGGQEFNKRAGTENTPSIVGFGVAAEYAQKNLSKNAAHMEQMRSHLLSRLQEELDGVTNIGDDGDENATSPNVRPNGPSDPALRLPNTLSVGFKNVHSGDLLSDIGHSVAASAGATCHGANSVSSVLRAMKIPHEFARGTVRLSLGPTTTRDDIDRASVLISDGVRRQWARQQANNGRKTSDVPVSQ